MKNEEQKELTIQNLFDELDEIIGRMEGEELSLEDSFTYYKKGMDLLKNCNEKMDQIEKKMMLIDDKGELHEFE